MNWNLFKGKIGVHPNIATVLIYSMAEYIKQAEKTSKTNIPVISDVRIAYKRLLSLGMGETQNAKVLKAKIDQRDQLLHNNTKALNLIYFIKDVRDHFGPKSILVSNTAFKDVCNRYNLDTGLLKNYCGVIPEANIQDISNVLNKMDSFNRARWINSLDERFDSCLLYVTEIRLYESDIRLQKYINDRDCIITVKNKKKNYDNAWWASDIVGLKEGVDYQYGALNKLFGEILDSKTLFIACPKKYLKNPELKVSKYPVDPIVFQYTPYGILIHTMWGEEAEDKALQEFMRINTKINNI